jgi:aminomethyltransferase
VLKTPLYDWHAAHGATFVPFAGYDMPVHYGSIKEEHFTVRQAVGLFDVSHMSNLNLNGAGAAKALAKATPSQPAALPLGKGKYTVVLRPDGTILDDTIYFRTGPEHYTMIPNAGRNEEVAEHLRALGAHVEDVTLETGIFALQGPKAREVLAAAALPGAQLPKFHHIVDLELAGIPCRASGTGYTGEKGVEVYVPAKHAVKVWQHILEAGKSHGIRPIGLGARDTLRLEKGYCLAGNEFEGGRTPIEAGLEWTMDWSGDFLGKARLQEQKSGDHERLVGLRMDRGIPRHGYEVHKDGKRIGTVTSGTLSPTLNVGIALAYVRGAEDGDVVDVMIRDRPHPATVVKPPFV